MRQMRAQRCRVMVAYNYWTGPISLTYEGRRGTAGVGSGHSRTNRFLLQGHATRTERCSSGGGLAAEKQLDFGNNEWPRMRVIKSKSEFFERKRQPALQLCVFVFGNVECRARGWAERLPVWMECVHIYAYARIFVKTWLMNTLWRFWMQQNLLYNLASLRSHIRLL